MTTLLAQNTPSRDADDLLAGNIHLEANDTYWSDTIKMHYALGSVTVTEPEAMSADYNLLSPVGPANTDYWVSQIQLRTNVVVGPARYGALVEAGYGRQLFLSDPSLPLSVWV